MAFEMARQLRAAGHEVGALVLLEPPRLGGRSGRGAAAFDPIRLRNTGGLVRKIRLYWAKWQLWDGPERIADLRRQVAKVRRKGVRKGAGVLPEYVRSDVEPWEPREYAGRATLVLARHERFRHERLEEWRALVSGVLEVRVVPGIHAAIVQEPFVRVLAREVEKSLVAAEAGT
jgi:thioesterase domain-containing protein